MHCNGRGFFLPALRNFLFLVLLEFLHALKYHILPFSSVFKFNSVVYHIANLTKQALLPVSIHKGELK